MPKALITGGLGFLGRALTQKLVEMGKEVVIFDVADEPKLEGRWKEKVTKIRGDIVHLPLILEALKTHEIDTIYHAGALLPPVSEQNLHTAFAVNVQGTVNVLEAARLGRVPKVIFVSTIATYGLGLPPVVNEDMPQQPRNMYGTTKVCCERLGEQYHRLYGVNFRAVRFPPILGAGRRDSAQSAFSYLAIREPTLGRPYTIYIEKKDSIPVLYIRDAVQGLISLNSAEESQLERRVYNIHGFSLSAGDLAEMVKKYIPTAQISFHPDPAMMDIIRGWPTLDDTRARQEWGWQPEYLLEESVKDFILEVQANLSAYQ
jgi:nucleoside-diphosphate-sugar epimerase